MRKVILSMVMEETKIAVKKIFCATSCQLIGNLDEMHDLLEKYNFWNWLEKRKPYKSIIAGDKEDQRPPSKNMSKPSNESTFYNFQRKNSMAIF